MCCCFDVVLQLCSCSSLSRSTTSDPYPEQLLHFHAAAAVSSNCTMSFSPFSVTLLLSCYCCCRSYCVALLLQLNHVSPEEATGDVFLSPLLPCCCSSAAARLSGAAIRCAAAPVWISAFLLLLLRRALFCCCFLYMTAATLIEGGLLFSLDASTSAVYVSSRMGCRSRDAAIAVAWWCAALVDHAAAPSSLPLPSLRTATCLLSKKTPALVAAAAAALTVPVVAAVARSSSSSTCVHWHLKASAAAATSAAIRGSGVFYYCCVSLAVDSAAAAAS